MLIRKFSMCTVDVKCSLFRTYVTPLYTAQLWTNYTKGSMRRLKVAYNDALRLLLQVPRWHNASELFVTNGLPTLEALLRNLMHGFICRLDQSKNSVMEALSSPVISCYRYTSGLRQHWRDSLYTYKMQWLLCEEFSHIVPVTFLILVCFLFFKPVWIFVSGIKIIN